VGVESQDFWGYSWHCWLLTRRWAGVLLLYPVAVASLKNWQTSCSTCFPGGKRYLEVQKSNDCVLVRLRKCHMDLDHSARTRMVVSAYKLASCLESGVQAASISENSSMLQYLIIFPFKVRYCHSELRYVLVSLHCGLGRFNEYERALFSIMGRLFGAGMAKQRLGWISKFHLDL
jgi:hypothetical protein